ncbi:MAG: GNAT family N-acetyltransferase [Paludibacteraceae bacterium]|nr:GNAT family N-acetyltransferase [Paludibacteraceae bacterium]
MPARTDIFLRKLEPDDLPLLYQWENDTDAWLDGNTHNPLSHDDLRDYIMRTTGDIFRDGQLRLMICPALTSTADIPLKGEAVSTEPVGCVDLYDVDIRNRKAAVAVYIAPNRRGEGLASQALTQLKSYVAHTLCFRLLYALVRKTNLASENLFLSAGFERVAVLPKWINEGDILVLQTLL